jgi:hypothetical protein
MDYVEIQLLKYKFHFRQLKWREEFLLKFPEKKDPVLVILAHALVEISGLKVTTIEEAQRIIDTLPYAIVTRVFKLYRGSRPLTRKFFSAGVYKAPPISTFARRVEEDKRRMNKKFSTRLCVK